MGTFVVGDLHGAYKTFISLLKKAKFNIDKDELYSLGDIIDRGSGVKQLLDFFYSNNYKIVHSNHHDKAHRLALGNKVQTTKALRDTRSQLGENWREYFLKFGQEPNYYELEDAQGKLYLFHGGWEAGKSAEEQSANVLLRLRHYPHEKFNPDKERDALSLPWQLQEGLKDIDFSLVHGHIAVESVHAFCNPMIYSLDYGTPRPTSRLAGMWLDSREVISVDTDPDDILYYIENYM